MKLSFAGIALAVVGIGALTVTSIAAQAQMVYVATANGEFGTMDVATGTFTSINNSLADQLYGLALSPDGKTLYALSSDAKPTLYTVDTTTGNLTSIGDVGVTFTDINNSLVFGPNGKLYALDGTSNLYTVDLTTGAATKVGAVGNKSSAGLAYNGMMYEVDDSNVANNNLDSLNTTTGQGTKIGAIGYSEVLALAAVNGTVYGFTKDDNIITINTATGAGTFKVGYSMPTTNDWISAATVTSSVPEPGTCTLIASTAVAGAAFLRRRRNRR